MTQTPLFCDILIGGQWNGRRIGRGGGINARPELQIVEQYYQQVLPIEKILRRPYHSAKIAVLVFEKCLYVWDGNTNNYGEYMFYYVPKHYDFTIRQLLAAQDA